MTCVDFVNVFDFECILMNGLSGTWLIFSLLSIMAIAILVGMFRMPNFAFGILIVLFTTMFANEMPALYYISVLTVSFIVWAGVASIIKR